ASLTKYVEINYILILIGVIISYESYILLIKNNNRNNKKNNNNNNKKKTKKLLNINEKSIILKN
ncbi:MAG: hypothetical protein ACRD8K_06110, partial [Nitrososphaeraceae archaeon]